MSGLAAIVLDFDGVVLESVDVKTRSFVELFGGHDRDRVVRIHLDNPGTSRYDKFRMIHEALFGSYDKGLEPHLDARFSAIVRREMSVCPFVPGARQFLRHNARRYQLFVASAAPEAELREIVAERGIALFFRGVYGTPRSKAEILAAILRDESLDLAQAVFVGDAPSDQEAAATVGIPFIGRTGGADTPALDADRALATVADLAELRRRWDEIVKPLVAGRESRAPDG